MTDMVVDLYKESKLPKDFPFEKENIHIQRALAIDKAKICEFVEHNFTEICPGWVEECESTLYRHPTSCFIAIKNKNVVGFACYDGTAKGMIGPIGVSSAYRNLGIAKALLNKCFEGMKMEGYAYAIIGWVSSTEFYEKSCGAVALPDNFPGIYSRMVIYN
ncbi:GNAT family N-acetyltransferase [Gilvimarinus sp. SDUM040013]|uniref:GNAT family N-acetyltransferase n=1 Tax=Gilvimarinus gilvus TaxID=3058038 RepID=A0ABU4S500_9GAMM|nr:GNAT family N-acetyltransferase [Gilvimarinus sp. SDUM040013]MDO3385383.1 GNAT family N-acetyltransferase [Gilvimarinus sp. SDUM040013]MDX6850958.1 GNAT family N-acetyltransferase [Gilvimarinus sp. SDUM040013]